MISIITPIYAKNNQYVAECYESLREQTYMDWQWVCLLNNGGELPEHIASDPKVKIVDVGDAHTGNIGKLKKMACEASDGEFIVELDGDDLLTEEALFKIRRAFADDIHFVYSNSAMFEDTTWKPGWYGEQYGWVNRPFEYKGHKLTESVSFAPTVHSMRRVEWAPNHVRAWRKSSYLSIGGHDPEILLGDDHDLVCRFYITYGEKGFGWIDECIYLYRTHENNTCVTANKGVQEQVAKNYWKYFETMALRWAMDNNHIAVEVGGGLNPAKGYITCDLRDTAHIKADLNEKWPFGDNSIGVLRAHHIFEHLTDPIHTMNEAYRVLVPGGILLIEVPSTDGRGAFCDPTHKSFWNERSFAYYTEANTARFIQPQFTGRFQNSLVTTFYPSEWWKQQQMSVVRADLFAIKPGYDRYPGGIQI